MKESSRTQVQQSIEQLSRYSEQFQQIFYRQLYSRIPACRTLFRNSTAEKTKLVSMLQTLARLEHFESLKPAILALGKRHQNYGIESHMYPDFKQAILASLAEVPGDTVSDKTILAWEEVLDEVIAIMLEGVNHD